MVQYRSVYELTSITFQHAVLPAETLAMEHSKPISSHTVLPIGVAESGLTHSSSALPEIASRYQLARDAGVFDFVNRSPPDAEFRAVLHAVESTGMPVLAGTFIYTAGRDEPLFERNIIKGRLLGSTLHDVQLATHHADGHPLSDDEVADWYLRCHDFAGRHEITVGFEVHVNTWTEHFGRVSAVAQRVAQRGVAFGLTFDPSHVIFKIDNPAELKIQNLGEDVAAGRVVIDPRVPGNILHEWINAGYVVHCHARAAVPGNPVNIWASHPDGSHGRGIQYPLIKPGADEWHSPWEPDRLTAWKDAIRYLLTRHASRADSRLRAVTCEFIPAIDYGGGARYSILAQNIACANWLRGEISMLATDSSK